MKRNCDRHQRGFLGGQRSRRAGILGCGPAGRPSFSRELPGPIFRRQHGCGLAETAKQSL
eukprot:1149875-Pelagomonas_calceolata.AAC.1